ncbi:nucleotidyltransferase domain-containing protein [Chengkuizengella marina]|uniref:Nucleotidyltransferase domain-containing protein n=1 Tax=Chengkuizengella marina TaxID=2507566 RepID=A0A6N9Q6V7_9BACL|nr:nucleotidyltransferase domain-containing protein [Chengkuizengella marina]NBI30549.1 nucleotidyltransferase domain-containing protein [Chengkuizengella marina]
MYEHHKKTIEKLIHHFEKDPNVLALLIGGSVAKGYAKENSDVDFILVVTDETFNDRKQNHDLFYWSGEFCDYEGGYVDGKFTSLQFLKDVAERGSEPARFAFCDAIEGFSKIEELEPLLQKITTYPENEQKQKIESFYTQFEAARWYVNEAEKRNDKYLMMHIVSSLVLFGGRLILAHNKVLYPYHKWFMRKLSEVKNKPVDFMQLTDRLLSEPNKENAESFCKCVLEFTQWPEIKEGWPNRFMIESEWNWMNGTAPIADL